MFRIYHIGLFILLISLSPVLAQNSGKRFGPDHEQCSEVTTVGMVRCLSERTAFWDRRLNSAYKAAMADEVPAQRKRLRVAQRLWIKYRDANCEFYASGEGTISRIEGAECLRSMTASRALELERGGQP